METVVVVQIRGEDARRVLWRRRLQSSMAGIYNKLLSSIPEVEKGVAFSIEATNRMQFELLAKDDEISDRNRNRDPSSSEEAIVCEGEAEENMIIMKKPDRLLPCPRCESLNTKFCYFNNCNAKQPRHLCRSCQRYWTAGGTLRKVPMGSGRRKSKRSSSSTSHLTTHPFLNLSSGLSVRSDALDSAQQLPPASTSTVFTTTLMNKGCSLQAASDIPKLSSTSIYRNETPLFQTPVANNLGNGSFEMYASNERRSPSNSASDIPKLDPVSIYRNEAPLSRTPVVNCLHNASNEGRSASNLDCETPEVSFKPYVTQGLMGSSPFGFPMGPWPYGYGLFKWNNATLSSMLHNDRGLITPSDSWFGHPRGPWMGGLPWPLMYHVPSWPPGPWYMPIPPPPWSLSPTLGKQPQEGLTTFDRKEGCILTPKTLRIRNPEEAVQSSIWSALGLDSRSDLPAGGIFKGFPPKLDIEEPLSVQALLVNPVAMTRLMVFHENT